MIRRCSRCSSISLSYASSRQNLAVHRRGSANTGRSFRPQLRVCKIINVLESFALAQLDFKRRADIPALNLCPIGMLSALWSCFGPSNLHVGGLLIARG